MRKGVVSVILGCSLLFLFAWINTLQAQEKKRVPPEKIKGEEIGYQIVTVNDVKGVRPLNIKAKKGTAMIWLNDGYSPLSITFKGEQKENRSILWWDPMEASYRPGSPTGPRPVSALSSRGSINMMWPSASRETRELPGTPRQPSRLNRGGVDRCASGINQQMVMAR
ncbi:MAG: hypothetical protein HYS70_06905 [Nitrospinae bacterium]|nr:hypothetical protein [Nitrospinota bacterium]